MTPERQFYSQGSDKPYHIDLRLRVYKKFRNIPREMADAVINSMPMEKNWLAELSNPQLTSDLLIELKKIYTQIQPLNSSLVGDLIAERSQFYSEIFEKDLDSLMSLKDVQNPDKAYVHVLCALLDFYQGSGSLGLIVSSAGSAIQGDLNAYFEKISDETSIASIPNQVKALLQLREGANKNAALLKTDPTAGSLIKRVIKTFEDGSYLLPPFYNRRLFVKGAKFAQQAFPIIYPVAEAVNKK